MSFNLYGTAAGFATAWRTDLYSERCCKEECLDTIIMTTCGPMTSEVAYMDNCCCSFTEYGSNAQLKGVQTSLTCIATDVRYNFINMVFDEYVTYVCCNFHGTGDGLTITCCADSRNERCYTCIATDVRYTYLNMVLDEYVTYVCCNFYGTGNGFTITCRAGFCNERCCKKKRLVWSMDNICEEGCKAITDAAMTRKPPCHGGGKTSSSLTVVPSVDLSNFGRWLV